MFKTIETDRLYVLGVNDEQHFKKYNKTWKKVEKLMKVDFESKYTYGYDDKYIKTKINYIITIV